MSIVGVLLQQGRLKFAQMPMTDTLLQELLTFKVKIDPSTAHDSYSAWREKDHDDLVLALALACWWGEREAASRVPDLNLAPALDPCLRRPAPSERSTGLPRWSRASSAPRLHRWARDDDEDW